MTRTHYRLALALMLSLLLHAAPFVNVALDTKPPPKPAPPIQANLRAPALPPSVPLILTKQAPTEVEAVAKKALMQASKASPQTKAWSSEIRRQFQKQQARGDFYPREAIAQGLEGEVLVLMLLDQNGQVTAARVEQSSGEQILDAAALRAVRALHSLPGDAPRETYLPVRFRLH